MPFSSRNDGSARGLTNISGVSNYINQLIREGEHQQLDFKYGITDSRKIARTLSAFSNTRGGRLLIGIKDNGNISGVKTEEEYYMLEAAAQMYCRPEISFEVKKWQVNEKTVLEAIIPEAPEKPVLAPTEQGPWKAFIRVNDQNLVAARVILKIWKLENRKHGLSIKYTRKERMLIEWLEKNETITHTQFCRIATLTRDSAENILAHLVVLGVLSMEVGQKQILFRLNAPDEKI